MSDIVMIALEYFTDFTKFEQLAAEIMRDEGYPTIKPLGGMHDEGIDAIQSRTYVAEGKRITIFQVSTQQDASGKIIETIEKLKDNKEEYDELVYVTTREIPTERQQDIKKRIRREYDVSLEIYERKTIMNRLADFGNGMFARYFPDIEAQIATLKVSPTLDAQASSAAYQEALLRTSLGFVMGEPAARARKTIFRTLLLGIVIDATPRRVPTDQLRATLGSWTSGARWEDSQVESALKVLESEGLISHTAAGYIASPKAVASHAGSLAEYDIKLDSLVDDIVQEVRGVSGLGAEIDTFHHVRKNVHNTLTEFLRLFGTELVSLVTEGSEPTRIYHECIPELQAAASKGVPKELGKLILDAIATVISGPTETQAHILGIAAMGYLGAAVLTLDPALRELGEARLSSKTFFLDTDIVVSCIVADSPLHPIYYDIIDKLVKCGCNVIVPENSVEECSDHAEIAKRTYHHFGDGLLSLPEAVVTRQVWNGFVKGYYFSQLRRTATLGMSFDRYMQNYYERDNPLEFMRDVIRTSMPAGVKISALTEYISDDQIPDAVRTTFKEAVLHHLEDRSVKAEYRSSEHNRKLAENDTRLFLSTYFLNSSDTRKKSGVLCADYYLVTSSGRFLVCARQAGLKASIMTRPQSLSGLLGMVGKINTSPKQFVKLFENPFLVHAVQESWQDMEALMKAGVNLRGSNLARLRWDLDHGIHDRLTALTTKDATPATGATEDESTADLEYLELATEVRAKGYSLIPELRSLQDELDNRDEALKELAARYGDLENRIEHFGKRKQRYLRKIAHRATSQ